MILYRLVNPILRMMHGRAKERCSTALNHKGTLLFIPTSISLATLEILVHINQDRLLSQFSLLSIDINDKYVMKLSLDHLPTDWNKTRNPPPWILALYGLITKIV